MTVRLTSCGQLQTSPAEVSDAAGTRPYRTHQSGSPGPESCIDRVIVAGVGCQLYTRTPQLPVHAWSYPDTLHRSRTAPRYGLCSLSAAICFKADGRFGW